MGAESAAAIELVHSPAASLTCALKRDTSALSIATSCATFPLALELGSDSVALSCSGGAALPRCFEEEEEEDSFARLFLPLLKSHILPSGAWGVWSGGGREDASAGRPPSACGAGTLHTGHEQHCKSTATALGSLSGGRAQGQFGNDTSRAARQSVASIAGVCAA